MIATQAIPFGTRIHPSYDTSSNTDCDSPIFFEAVVPPVLLASERGLRCAHCFEKLNDTHSSHSLGRSSFNFFQYCSSECQKKASAFDSELIQLIDSDRSNNSNFHRYLTPITVLLYKIMCAINREETCKASKTTKSQMNELVSNDDIDGFSLSEEENHYRFFIAQFCMKLYQDTHHGDAPFNVSELVKFTSMIIYNCFSITDEEQKTIGLGLYLTAAIINHSCEPNLVQTFAFGSGQNSNRKNDTPKLVLTASKNIENGQEMFISYTNPLNIFTQRDAYLKKEYKFQCDCGRCTKSRLRRTGDCDGFVGSTDDYDSLSETLICQTKGCKGSCYDYELPQQCKLCFSTPQSSQGLLFTGVRKLRDEATKITNTTSQKLTSQTMITEDDLRIAEYNYCKMKTLCRCSSWYVQESGTVLVDVLLNQINHHGNNNRDITQLCFQTLKVLEELEFNSTSQSLNPLSNIHNQLKIAKLLLYLSPDPRRAVSIIQNAKTTLSIYFPNGHQIIGIAEGLLNSAHQ